MYLNTLQVSKCNEIDTLLPSMLSILRKYQSIDSLLSYSRENPKEPNFLASEYLNKSGEPVARKKTSDINLLGLFLVCCIYCNATALTIYGELVLGQQLQIPGICKQICQIIRSGSWAIRLHIFATDLSPSQPFKQQISNKNIVMTADWIANYAQKMQR